MNDACHIGKRALSFSRRKCIFLKEDRFEVDLACAGVTRLRVADQIRVYLHFRPPAGPVGLLKHTVSVPCAWRLHQKDRCIVVAASRRARGI